VEGEGRGCERLRIEKLMMVSSGRLEPATFSITDPAFYHWTTRTCDDLKKIWEVFEEQ